MIDLVVASQERRWPFRRGAAFMRTDALHSSRGCCLVFVRVALASFLRCRRSHVSYHWLRIRPLGGFARRRNAWTGMPSVNQALFDVSFSGLYHGFACMHGYDESESAEFFGFPRLSSLDLRGAWLICGTTEKKWPRHSLQIRRISSAMKVYE